MAKRFVRSQNGKYKSLSTEQQKQYVDAGSIIFNEDEKIISAWGTDYVGTDTTYSAGKDITIGEGNVINHAEIKTTLTNTPPTVTTPLNYGEEFTVVEVNEIDNGHVTGVTSKRFKLPALPEFPEIPEVPEYDIKTQVSLLGTKVVLTKDNQEVSTITIKGGNDNVKVVSDTNNTVLIHTTDEKTTLDGHYAPTANTASELNTTGATNKGGLTAGESEVITGFKIERDEKGHVVGVVAETGTLPEGLKIDDVEIGNGKVSLQIAGAESTSFTLNQTGNATFNIPSASGDNYGVIKTGYAENGKNYPVQLDSNGKAYVSVGWTDTDNDTKCTSLNITAKAATVPTTDTVDVLTGGISASGTGTSLSGEVSTISVPTKKYVDSAIENGVKSLGDVLEFKGSTTSLPATAEKGDVYLVSAAFGDYEVGDLLIYDGSKWIAVNANWTATDGTATLEWGKTTTLATIGGVNIDATLPFNPNTNYYHTRKYDTGLQITEGTGVEDMYVPEAGATEYGVIKTGFTQDPTNKNYAVQLDENGHAYVSVDWKNDDTKYEAGTGLTLNGTTFNHSNSITAGTVSGTSGSVNFGGTLTIPSVTYDAQGHITSTSTTIVTLPGNPNTDTTYAFENGTAGSFGVTPKNGSKQTVTVDAEHEVINSFVDMTTNDHQDVKATDTIVGAIEKLDANWDWEILA